MNKKFSFWSYIKRIVDYQRSFYTLNVI